MFWESRKSLCQCICMSERVHIVKWFWGRDVYLKNIWKIFAQISVELSYSNQPPNDQKLDSKILMGMLSDWWKQTNLKINCSKFCVLPQQQIGQLFSVGECLPSPRAFHLKDVFIFPMNRVLYYCVGANSCLAHPARPAGWHMDPEPFIYKVLSYN